MMITVKMYKLNYVYGQSIFKYAVKCVLSFVCDTYLFFIYNGGKTDTFLIYGEYHKNSRIAATGYGNGTRIDISHLITFLWKLRRYEQFSGIVDDGRRDRRPHIREDNDDE